jgi:hypothetical protein
MKLARQNGDPQLLGELLVKRHAVARVQIHKRQKRPLAAQLRHRPPPIGLMYCSIMVLDDHTIMSLNFDKARRRSTPQQNLINARTQGDDTMARDSNSDLMTDLVARLKSGKLTRRAFLERATALGLSAAAATSLMSGTAHAAEPKKGGHLRVGVGHGSTTDSLDPATFENAFMSNGVGYSINNHIAELGTSGELEPELAESWDASDDAVQWVFKLRQGVEFHNGKTVDADDVVASVNHHRGEDSKSAAKPLLVQLKDIKADGKDTVVVELDGGNADFPFIISDYHIAIMPSSDGKVDATSGVGAGGYSIVNFEPGVRVDFKRHPNYWKEDRAQGTLRLGGAAFHHRCDGPHQCPDHG